MKSFLVFNTSFFGDTLLTGPLCQNLKLEYRDARVYFVANQPFGDAARYLQGVDEVLLYDKKGRHKGIGGAWRFYRQQKGKLPSIDAAFVVYGNERNILLARLFGAKEIYADGRGAVRFFLSNGSIDYGAYRHAQDKNAFLFTLYAKKPFLELPMRYLTPPQAKRAADELFYGLHVPETAKLVAVCATTKREEKDLDQNECAKLFGLLKQRGNLPVLVGAGDSSARYRDMLRGLSVDFVDLTNRTSIPELAAVLEKCGYLVSADTGTLHLGLAVGVPTVAVYYLNRPQHLATWAPKSLYRHRLLRGPDFSAEEMLRQLQELSEGREYA